MNSHHKPVSVTSSQCLAIVLQRIDANSTTSRTPNGHKLFQEFLEENRSCFWNNALVESVSSLEFVGFMRPGTLLVSGSEFHLECLRNAWARRILKSPHNYAIKSLGDIGAISMNEVPQAQFIPLPETLCLLISSMNKASRPATYENIVDALKKQYSGMTIPSNEVLYATLAALVAEGKTYCMGEHYFLSTPMMYAQYQANFMHSCVPPTWSNNDAAPYHVPYKADTHQPAKMCTQECQTGASIINAPATTSTHVYKKDMAVNADDELEKHTKNTLPKEKNGGFLTRLFRRSKSRDRKSGGQKQQTQGKEKVTGSKSFQPVNPSKINNDQHKNEEDKGGKCTPQSPQLGTFCAQFPPTEWLHDPRLVRQSMNSGQPFFRGRKGRAEKNGMLSVRERVWVPDADLAPTKSSRRRRERYEDRTRPIKSLHRLSKYMSSSSECLHYLGPVDAPSRIPEQLEQLDLEYTFPQREQRRRQRREQTGPRPAPLALATDVDLETTATDVMGDGGGRTSTPAPTSGPDADSPIPLNNTVEGDATNRANRGSDSAFSASPGVTESSNSNKYSSWSGSETHDHHCAPLVTPRDPMDHTYINHHDCKPLATHDRTYENLKDQQPARGHESTVFENMTQDGEEDSMNNNDKECHDSNKSSNSTPSSAPTCISAV